MATTDVKSLEPELLHPGKRKGSRRVSAAPSVSLSSAIKASGISKGLADLGQLLSSTSGADNRPFLKPAEVAFDSLRRHEPSFEHRSSVTFFRSPSTFLN
jgi:hypothetical protein